MRTTSGKQLMSVALECNVSVRYDSVQRLCRDNIFKFMHQKLGVPQDQCKATWRPLFAKTNQSLKVMHRGFHLLATTLSHTVNLLASYSNMCLYCDERKCHRLAYVYTRHAHLLLEHC